MKKRFFNLFTARGTVVGIDPLGKGKFRFLALTIGTKDGQRHRIAYEGRHGECLIRKVKAGECIQARGHLTTSRKDERLFYNPRGWDPGKRANFHVLPPGEIRPDGVFAVFVGYLASRDLTTPEELTCVLNVPSRNANGEKFEDEFPMVARGGMARKLAEDFTSDVLVKVKCQLLSEPIEDKYGDRQGYTQILQAEEAVLAGKSWKENTNVDE